MAEKNEMSSVQWCNVLKVKVGDLLTVENVTLALVSFRRDT
jgi:hypothetical protein